MQKFGEVAERLKAHDSKSCLRLRVTRVRIPPSPPNKAKGPLSGAFGFIGVWRI